MKKVVINSCYGGFGLSDLAYERLIELGIPVRKYIEEKRNKKTGLYEPENLNDGRIIFDRTLSPESRFCDADRIKYLGRYWDSWIDQERDNPLLVKVVEELGKKSWGQHAQLSIVEIPDDVKYEISEYDGIEHIAEEHRTWF